jgi:hypothetical protein
MTSFNIAKRILVAKRESVKGTAETLADADFNVRMRGIEFTPDLQGGDTESKFATGDYGGDTAISGIKGATFTSFTKLSQGATLGTAPKWGKLLESCGAVGTQYTTTGYGYEPLQAGDSQTSTFANVEISDDGTPVGLQDTAKGVMGNFTLSAEGVGSPIKIDYEWKGAFTTLADVANGDILALTSPDTSVGASFLNGTSTIGGTAFCVQSFSFNAGNTIEYLQCPSEATGIKYATIVNRMPTMTITMNAPTASSYNPYDVVKNNTEAEVVLSFGSFTFTAPVAQVVNYSKTDINGRLGYELTLKLNRNSGTNANISDEATWQLLQGATA